MQDNNDIYKTISHAILGTIGFLIFFLLFLFAMCSCTTTKYVPIEHTTLRTDTVYRSVWYTDTVIDRDTVRITEQGTEIIRWRVRTKETHDTICQSKTDSVYVDKVVEVERKLSKWQQTKMNLGGIAFGTVGALIVAFIVGNIKAKRNKT